MSLLTIHNLGKAYRTYKSEWQRFASWFGTPIKPSEEHWVLKNISFKINSGEAVGIIGQNGAGKSTLLKMITGTLQPTKGQVQVNGRIAAILELGMGFNPELTGRQNVFHAAGLMGFSADEIKHAIPDIEKFADIDEYFDQPMRTYSSGMQMRIAFSVATAYRPEILIIDEALAVGDASFQRKCLRRIEQQINEGTSLLLVSHDIESIKKICTKALFLKNGLQVKYGDVKKICDEYEQHLFGSSNISQKNTSLSDEEEQSTALIDPELLNINELNYGDERAVIEEVWFENDFGNHTNVINMDSSFVLKYRVLFKSSVNYPVFAFLIKTMEGISIYGTDTLSLGKQTKTYKTGESIEVSFHLKNHLAAGTYFINCGIRDESEESTSFLHRRIDVAMFRVTQHTDINQAGLINLAATYSSVRID
ncbi:MAG: ABC transporter ATP-binding protein [Proteobacteria bacterium]|nr:ABC transporter ATP-binding protein [Pseudomonadota bacterium]